MSYLKLTLYFANGHTPVNIQFEIPGDLGAIIETNKVQFAQVEVANKTQIPQLSLPDFESEFKRYSL